ncbi:hypothetical protein B0A48_00341 [Cryoendolithus antarcticus]|uniref:EKC/KEOPS complex subunit CGI121 n=1 Tax=Cryoendolithus antarcticus TaxID=1507870 RepID=A0A1V8TUD6_9PEZI|nr:hypothetical protein B0A48_00341 [Cryoendolithus antarcticus]
MESITVPHLPAHTLHVGLFKDVKNATFLRQQLLDINTDFQYAFADASMVASRQAVIAACSRAIDDSIFGRMKTRNLHSEIVFALSAISNISESFRRMGIQDTTKHVLAIKVLDESLTATQVHAFLGEHVHGTVVAFTDEELSSMQDVPRIRKIYKLPPAGKDENAKSLSKTDEAIVIGSMALRGS